MNDEGVGIAGWLLADLALVLAIVFLAFTPAAFSDDSDVVEATVAAPVILDLGCKVEEQTAEVIAVRCEPLLGGGEVDSYRWEAERGRARGYTGSHSFAASFAGAGAVRLTAANAGGAHSAAFPVLPPPVPRGGLVVEDFRFDQIVLTNVKFGAVEWETIAGGRVRQKLDKSLEDEDEDEGGAEGSVADFLRAKLDEGLRIALVETFSHEPRDRHRQLSDQVNDALYSGLLDALSGERGGVTAFFVDCDAREKWFASYRDTTFDEDEVRINLYFVRPQSDADCS